MLMKSQMQDAKPICTPAKLGSRLIQDSDPLSDPQLYHNIVGFMHCPTKTHWRTIKRILGYLKGYLTSSLVIRPCSDSRLVAYSDNGFVIYYGGNIGSWASVLVSGDCICHHRVDLDLATGVGAQSSSHPSAYPSLEQP
ncbi:hypothetical protein V2J09_000090 [Rumex salicifolius]